MGVISSNWCMIGAIAAGICSFVGTFVNFVNICVLLRGKLKNTIRPNFKTLAPLVFCQSVADLCFCLFGLPIVAVRYVYKEDVFEIFSENLCQHFVLFFYAGGGLSSFIKCLISVNRLYVTKNPDDHEKVENVFSWSRCFMYCSIIWIVCLGFLSLPYAGVWGEITQNNHTYSCTIKKRGE